MAQQTDFVERKPHSIDYQLIISQQQSVCSSETLDKVAFTFSESIGKFLCMSISLTIY